MAAMEPIVEEEQQFHSYNGYGGRMARVIDKRINPKTRQVEYQLQWQQTWEPASNIDQHSLDEYNNHHPCSPKKEFGFGRGLQPEEILAATKTPGKLHFLVKWKDSNEADLMPAAGINKYYPQLVIAFYEKRLFFAKGDEIEGLGD